MPSRNDPHKTCVRCKRELPLNEFQRNKSSPDGFWIYCRECDSLRRTKEASVIDLDGEIWRDIIGFEGVYMVSNYGRVKCRHNSHREILRTPCRAPNGYMRLVLSNKGRRLTISVHREVAKAFIPNPNKYDTVNHKDFDKTNNAASNLEWLPLKDNVLHAKNNGRNNRKPIAQYTKCGNLIKVWDSAYEVEKTLGFFATLISRCCRGIQKSHKGYIWKFQKAQ